MTHSFHLMAWASGPPHAWVPTQHWFDTQLLKWLFFFFKGHSVGMLLPSSVVSIHPFPLSPWGTYTTAFQHWSGGGQMEAAWSAFLWLWYQPLSWGPGTRRDKTFPRRSQRTEVGMGRLAYVPVAKPGSGAGSYQYLSPWLWVAAIPVHSAS